MNNRYLVVLQYLSHTVYHLYKMQYCPALHCAHCHHFCEVK